MYGGVDTPWFLPHLDHGICSLLSLLYVFEVCSEYYHVQVRSEELW